MDRGNGNGKMSKIRTQRSRIRSRTITLSKEHSSGSWEQHQIQVHVQQVSRKKTTRVATPEVDQLKECLRLAMKERLWLERQLSFLTQSLQQLHVSGDVDVVDKHVQLAKTNQTLSQHVEFLSSLVRQQHDVDHELKEKQMQCQMLENQLQSTSTNCQQLASELEKAMEKNQELVAYSGDVQLQMQRLQQQLKDIAEEKKAFEKEHSQLLSQLLQKKDEVTNLKKVKECDQQKSAETIEVLKSQLRELEKKCKQQKVKREELELEMDNVHQIKTNTELEGQEADKSAISNGLQHSLDDDDGQSDEFFLLCYDLRPKSISQSPVSQKSESISERPSHLPKQSQIDQMKAKLEQDIKILSELDRTRISIGLGPPFLAPKSTGVTETGVIDGYSHNNVTTVSSSSSTISNDTNSTASLSTFILDPNKKITTATVRVSSSTVATLTTEGEAVFKSQPDTFLSHEDPNNVLNIPGIGAVLVYIARYTYDPFQMSPNENPEAELMVNAGDYVLVSKDMDEDGFFDGQLLDGQRGLVPSNFMEKLTGEDLLEFQQHLAMDETLTKDVCMDATTKDHQRLRESCLPGDIVCLSNLDNLEDADEVQMEGNGDGPEFFSTLVAPPLNLTLEHQFQRSILISWMAPNTSLGSIDSFNVYVDGEQRTTVLATGRTRVLVERVDLSMPHRISVRSVTTNRRMSVDAACTIIIGKDVPEAPTCIRASSITSTTAIISWLPSNSNYQHIVCVNSVEARLIKPGIYRHTVTGLSPSTSYRVTVKVKNNSNEQKLFNAIMQANSTSVDFRTLPKGLPDPPLDVQVELGPRDGTLLITWIPVTINISGTSNGSQVTGYSIYADGEKVVDIDSPTGDHAILELTQLTSTPKHVTVRTKSGDSVSADSVQVQVLDNVLKSSKPISEDINKTAPVDSKVKKEVDDSSDRSELSDIAEEMEDDITDVQQSSRHQETSWEQQTYVGVGKTEKEWSKKVNKATNRTAKKTEVSKSRKETDLRVHSEVHYSARISTSSAHKQSTVINTIDKWNEKDVDSSLHFVNFPTIKIAKSSVSEGRKPLDLKRVQEGPKRNHRKEGGKRRAGHRESYDQPISGDSDSPKRSSNCELRGYQHHTTHSHTSTISQHQSFSTFVALFDYDPKTMSPNPEAFTEELPFKEGQTIKIYGDKDPDGFYWGEVKGRQGFVPCNMVTPLQGNTYEEQIRQMEPPRSESGYKFMAGSSRGLERWSDDDEAVPVKKMVALYDYDPHELSPNVDADVELSFNAEDVIYVYGDMDEDGFFMGQKNGVCGLVPSNFLTEVLDKYPEEIQRHSSSQLQGQRDGAEEYCRDTGNSQRTFHQANRAKHNFHSQPGSQQEHW